MPCAPPSTSRCSLPSSTAPKAAPVHADADPRAAALRLARDETTDFACHQKRPDAVRQIIALARDRRHSHTADIDTVVLPPGAGLDALPPRGARHLRSPPPATVERSAAASTRPTGSPSAPSTASRPASSPSSNVAKSASCTHASSRRGRMAAYSLRRIYRPLAQLASYRSLLLETIYNNEIAIFSATTISKNGFKLQSLPTRPPRVRCAIRVLRTGSGSYYQ